MVNAVIARSQALEAWLGRLMAGRETLAPAMVKPGHWAFQPVKDPGALGLVDEAFANPFPFRASACPIPPGKVAFSPARETLFRFSQREDGSFALQPQYVATECLLLGVRPCDLKAIAVMDRVMRDGQPDLYYLTRREQSLIVAQDCLQPCDEHCFCQAVGSLNWREGADLFMTPLAEGQLVEGLTPAGQALLADLQGTPCTDVPAAKATAEARRPQPFGRQFSRPLDALALHQSRYWNSPVWQQHVEACFSCGTCNLVCPTCYCFETRDQLDLPDLRSGQRLRTWDACMLPEFAAVAGGHNFRASAAGRQRHRVKRKFDYPLERYHQGPFCVGCGRCGQQCTVNIDIFAIVNDLISPGGFTA